MTISLPSKTSWFKHLVPLGTSLFPKRVCLIFRGGSCSCQLSSVCMTRGILSSWVQFLPPNGYPWLDAHLADMHLRTHKWSKTHMDTHLVYLPLLSEPLSRDSTLARRSTRTGVGWEKIKQRREKINPKLYTARVKEAKDRFKAAPQPYMPTFTFNSPSPKGVIYISTLEETSGNYSRPHNYSLIHIHNTLHILCNRLALKTN